MNRKMFISELAKKLGVARSTAEQSVDTLIDVITEALLTGQEVNLQGFGGFKLVNRKSKNGYNPRTKEKMIIPAYSTVVFRAGSTIKKLVRAKFDK